MWDPVVYRRFGTERSRPFADLVARIGAEAPRAVTDLGCGPGELTLTLAGRWPAARLSGVDSSAEMIAKATAHGGPAEFTVGDVRDWRPGPDVDVLVTNATLQWVPEHRDLLTRWAGALPPGAWLAMQVPGNFDAPSHRALRRVGAGYGLADVLREAPVDDAVGYTALLTAAGAARSIRCSAGWRAPRCGPSRRPWTRMRGSRSAPTWRRNWPPPTRRPTHTSRSRSAASSWWPGPPSEGDTS
jgi:trans-aconitate 2-methyltransferase